MGKFDGYLICSDIDGTLTGRDGEIPQANIDAINYFCSEGGLFTVATGRFAHYVEKFDFTVNAPVVCVNGTAIFDLNENKLLETFGLCGDYSEQFRYFAENYFDKINSAEICYLDDSVVFDGAQLLSVDPFLKKIESGNGLKVVFRFRNEDDAVSARLTMNKKFSDKLNFFRAWPVGLEAIVSDSGKGKCVKLLKEKYYSSVHTTVGIGDFENDISLLRDCDIGYAVENAVPEVKQYADRMAPHSFDNAVAYVVDSLKKM